MAIYFSVVALSGGPIIPEEWRIGHNLNLSFSLSLSLSLSLRVNHIYFYNDLIIHVFEKTELHHINCKHDLNEITTKTKEDMDL